MMPFDPITAFVAIGSIAGSAGVTRYVSNRTADKLEKHEQADNKFHTETIDRLARIETKLDTMLRK